MPAAKGRKLVQILAALAVLAAVALPAGASIPRPGQVPGPEPAALLAAAREAPAPQPNANPRDASFELFAEPAGDRFRLSLQAAADAPAEARFHLLTPRKTRVRGFRVPEPVSIGVELPPSRTAFRLYGGVPYGFASGGLYVTTDPLGYTDSPNLYQYGLNNPVNFSDPMGLATWTINDHSFEVPDVVDEKVKLWVARGVGFTVEELDQLEALYRLKDVGLDDFVRANMDQLLEFADFELEYIDTLRTAYDERGGVGFLVEYFKMLPKQQDQAWESVRHLPFFHTIDAHLDAQQANDPIEQGMAEGRMYFRGVEDLLLLLGFWEGGAARSSAVETRWLSEARSARDALSAELKPLARRAPPTVTGGYNIRTGEVAARACGGGKCAEDLVVEALGGNRAEVRFTEAVRPRTGEEVPICLRCEATYGRDPFPPGTKFKSD